MILITTIAIILFQFYTREHEVFVGILFHEEGILELQLAAEYSCQFSQSKGVTQYISTTSALLISLLTFANTELLQQ